MRDPFVPTLLDRFFSEPEAPLTPQAAVRVTRPRIDLFEEADSYEVVVDLPGVTREEVEVQFEDGVLEISGECTASSQGEDARWPRRERTPGKFARTIAFRDDVEVGAIEATVKDGLLRVRVPKAERSKPRQIPVTVH